MQKDINDASLKPTSPRPRRGREWHKALRREKTEVVTLAGRHVGLPLIALDKFADGEPVIARKLLDTARPTEEKLHT